MTERVRRAPYSVILLDEIEKAHPDLFNILLQVFEDGHLTDGLGNTVDFKNTILIMTSNIGARYLQRRSHLGFQSAAEGATEKKAEDMVMAEVKRLFNPEFLNRLDEIIVFNALTDDDLMQILDLLVGQMNQNLEHKNISITLSREASQWILEKTCEDRSYGARPLAPGAPEVCRGPTLRSLDPGGDSPSVGSGSGGRERAPLLPVNE